MGDHRLYCVATSPTGIAVACALQPIAGSDCRGNQIKVRVITMLGIGQYFSQRYFVQSRFYFFNRRHDCIA